MNEMQAALGLLQVQHIDQALARRAEIAARYREAIDTIPGLSIVPDAGQQVANHAYCPILVGDDYPLSRDVQFRGQYN
jgi:dTDP-4-amino-4,6-dideoxygalactose transaminase